MVIAFGIMTGISILALTNTFASLAHRTFHSFLIHAVMTSSECSVPQCSSCPTTVYTCQSCVSYYRLSENQCLRKLFYQRATTYAPPALALHIGNALLVISSPLNLLWKPTPVLKTALSMAFMNSPPLQRLKNV